MAYVSHKAADVFISYARVDNQEMADRRWVSDFTDALTKRLDQELAVSCGTTRVWMDQEIDGSAPLTRQLLDAIDGAAVLLCVVSPGYLQSRWCELEWAGFLKNRLARPHAGRLFFVFIRDIPRDTLPAPIQALDLPGYEFWDRHPETKHDYTVGGPGEPSEKPEAQIHRQLERRLIRDLARELRRLKQLGPTPPARVGGVAAPALPAVPAAGGAGADAVAVGASAPAQPALSRELLGQCIYLAEVTDDLDDLRDSVRSYLQQRQAVVVPAQWYTDRQPEAYAASVLADMARATAFVQLLGPGRGREKSQAMPLGLPGLQHRLALERSHDAAKPLAVHRWRPEALDTATLAAEDWRAFIEAPDVTACPIEAFKALLLKRLKPPPPPPTLPPGGGRMVFVNSDRSDGDMAKQLRADLGRLQVQVFSPFWDQSPKDFNAERKLLLKQCHGIIHVYGQAGPVWVRRQLLESAKVLAERKQQVRGKALVKGPPPTNPELDVELPDFLVIDCTGGVDTRALAEFVGRLGD